MMLRETSRFPRHVMHRGSAQDFKCVQAACWFESVILYLLTDSVGDVLFTGYCPRWALWTTARLLTLITVTWLTTAGQERLLFKFYIKVVAPKQETMKLTSVCVVLHQSGIYCDDKLPLDPDRAFLRSYLTPLFLIHPFFSCLLLCFMVGGAGRG